MKISLTSLIIKYTHSLYYVFILDSEDNILSCNSTITKRGAKRERKKMLEFWRQYHPQRNSFTDPRMSGGVVYEQEKFHDVTVYSRDKVRRGSVHQG